MRVWILESEEVVCSRGDSAVVGAYSSQEIAEEAAAELELHDFEIFDLVVV